MLGAIAGDIVGSAYEFNNLRRKDFRPLFHAKARITDDTICTVAVADILLNGRDPATTLQAWCQRHEDLGRWGRQFFFWIAEEDPKPYGSWGNGGAMRVSPAGMMARSEEEALQLADRVTLITHNHPEAIASAWAVALAVLWSRRREPVEMIVEELEARFSYNLQRTPDDIRPGYKHSERAIESVPEAIVCGLQATSFEDALRNAVSIGGDSDTICAIAGAIAEARFGIPQEIRDKALSFLTDDMRAIVDQFYARWDNEAGLVWSCGGRQRQLLDFECPMEWMQLEPTSEVSIRHCGRCDQDVHLCAEPEQFVAAAKQGHCVALPLSLEVPAALSPGGLGMPPPWSYELESRAKQWWQAVGDSGEQLPRLRRQLSFTQDWAGRQSYLHRERSGSSDG